MSLIPSPDGGVFAALFSNASGSLFNRESFYTDVTNLTVGKVYTLRFYIVMQVTILLPVQAVALD